MTDVQNDCDLRLRLIELLAPSTGADVVRVAREAEAFVLGPIIRLTPEFTTETLAAELRQNMEICQTVDPLPSPPPSRPKKMQPPRWWTPERTACLEEMAAEDLSYEQMAERLGTSAGAISGKIHALGLSAKFPRRPGRQRRANATPLPKPASPAPVPCTTTPPALPAASAPAVDARTRMIEEHIKAHGVTRAIDFGADQPAVDALKHSGFTVCGSRNPRQPWLVNGAPRSTPAMWAQANKALAERGCKPIRRRAG